MYINIRLDEISNIRLNYLKAKYESNQSKLIRDSIFLLNPEKLALYNDYGELKYRIGIYITNEYYNYLKTLSLRQARSINNIILNAINQLYESKEKSHE